MMEVNPSIASLEDFRRQARRRLPRAVFDFVEGGAGDEVTLRENRSAFERVTFQPRALVDVSRREQSTTVLGTHVTLPVLLAPAGLARLVSREGELAVARAAGRAGTIFVLSTAASCSIEEVAAAASGPLWFQLYLGRDRDVGRSLVERAATAGYAALCLTIDVPVPGRRDRDVRNGVTVPPRITRRNAFDVAHRFSWLRDVLIGPPITFKNLTPYAGGMTGAVALAAYHNEQLVNAGATWNELLWLRGFWSGPLVVKGVMTAKDACRAIECGADAVVVSNHGGRQLDGLPASIDVLPEIVDAVQGRAEVLIDGGIRRGTDVVKALALGARACLVGRPYLFALAAAGEEGVLGMLEMLRAEIDCTLALVGCTALGELDRSSVGVSPPGNRTRSRSTGGGPSEPSVGA